MVMKCLIKTDPSSIAGPGGIIGFDVYSDYERILEVHPCTPQEDVWQVPNDYHVHMIYVPYGSDWTQITIDVVIPNTVYTINDYGRALTHGAQRISGLIPWLGASWNNGESASVWFANAELYINP